MIEYFNSDSFIHNLDPRTKMFFSICIVGSTIMTSSKLSMLNNSLIFLFFLIIISLIIWKLATIPIKKFKPFFSGILIIIFIGVITQSIFYADQAGSGDKTLIFNLMPFNVPIIGYLPVTIEGIEYGIVFAMKMVILFISPLIIPFTTHPTKIILMFRKFKFPEWMVLLFTIAIRFLPLTIQNLTITRNAQKLRKDKFSFKDLLLLLESIIISSLRTAKQMSLNLDVKSFGYSKKRTSLKTINFKKNDLIFLVFSLFIFILSIIFRGFKI